MSKETNIFETATRSKFRFPYKGTITVEDLWDLPLTALDSIYKQLNKQMKQSQEDSLLETKSSEDVVLDTKIAIIKHIVAVKKQEIADRALEKERKEKRQKIMAIMEARDEKALENASDETLKKMLDELSD